MPEEKDATEETAAMLPAEQLPPADVKVQVAVNNYRRAAGNVHMQSDAVAAAVKAIAAMSPKSIDEKASSEFFLQMTGFDPGRFALEIGKAREALAKQSSQG